ARLDPRARELERDDRARRRAPARVLARARCGLRARGNHVRARDASVPLGALALRRAANGVRRDARRARPAALLPPRLVAAGRARPGVLEGRARLVLARAVCSRRRGRGAPARTAPAGGAPSAAAV